ncbi:MAG: serine acetyltransferase [Planctomycetes bacterium]|nr:serine acetyltransferase [Planctomycetota bacterium]
MEAKDVPPASAANLPTRLPRGEHLGYTMRGDVDQNPPGMSLFALLREDLRTHESLFAHGFVALAVNRFGNWRMRLPRLLRAPCTLVYRFLELCTLWLARIELPYIVKVGRRVRIWHSGGCVLGALYIGDDVQIRHNVTLGLAHHGAPLTSLPIIEERVLIGVGACVLGPITIGHDSVIAANAVVTQDVPPYSLVGGIPGRVLRKLEETERVTSVNVRGPSGRAAA